MIIINKGKENAFTSGLDALTCNKDFFLLHTFLEKYQYKWMSEWTKLKKGQCDIFNELWMVLHTSNRGPNWRSADSQNSKELENWIYGNEKTTMHPLFGLKTTRA